ncbi:MAG TPA: ATP-binding protein, partial [Ktedonobacterales bacterium]|nr:ATP-binding protein [Ktedonobacterales bacterium]
PLPPDQLPQQRAARGESFSMEFTLDAETGERRWFEADGQPIHGGENEQQRWGVLVIRDITDRSLRRLQDEFIAMASHELRTPLTPLQSYLQMLLKLFADRTADDLARHYTESSLEQVRRLARLVGDLLDVSRLQSGKYTFKSERIAFNQLVVRAVEAAQTLAAGQAIRLDTTDVPLNVVGDPDRMEQALLNLFTNAITYAPETKHIDVRLRRASTNAEVRIRDYGPGIPAADISHLFNRFYQAERADRDSRRGLGLGLYITREIVTAHGGTITAESQNGKGATFIITLPLAAEQPR